MKSLWTARWQALAGAVPEFVAVLDRQGRLLWANRLEPGRKRSQVIGRKAGELMRSGRREFEAALRKTVRTGKPREIAIDHLGANGTTRRYRCLLSPVLVEGKVAEVVSIGRDVSDEVATEKGRSVTARVMAAAENERKRVSMELHDSVSQLLAAVGHGLRAAQGRMSIYEPAADDVRRSSAMLTEAIEEVRRIARNLRPPLLDDLGLIPALRVLAQEFTENSRIRTTVDLMEGEPPIGADAKLALYRIAQEALSNADRHSGASRVRIRCGCKLGVLKLSIDDDGRGFELAEAATQETLGLANLRERASLVSGLLNVRSQRGRGTSIEVTMPIRERRKNKR